jgi:PAS domain S-box-containing protein
MVQSSSGCFSNNAIRSGKILIIEDSSLFHNALRKGLNALGHTVEGAFNLEEALAKLENKSYDLVILDLHLPDGEGEDLLERLNTRQKLKIVVYTSDPDKERRNEWFRYGVLGYLSKNDPFPYVIEEINRTIYGIFENADFNILLIDDSSVVRRQITALLQPRNYQVFTAIDSKQAFEEVSKRSHDLIILDLELPDVNGEEILKQLKKNKETADIAVIIMTGRYDADIVRRLLKQGANEFFLKPFIAEELLMKIDFWIDSKRKTRQIECERQLLQEYKDTVDRSSIVSKTDKRGIITFVNDKFCEISGYSLAELIGKPHNIVRHPDMPKEIFEELWQTILSGQVWEGIVKNRKKDGSPYWVQTTINPIVDIDGNIVEYIGVRTDITELQQIKESLQDKLNISEDHFEDIYRRSQLYENAINESNILSRTTADGTILYVNNRFCEITGYNEEEIIGKTHAIVRHPDTERKVFADMWKTIRSGDVWHGVLKNRKKDGSPYWVDSTIIPIKDKGEKIIEYMAIRHEVTEIITLHEEIEKTQQEIIYRMGEIGESRSKETGNHVRRVAEYSKLLALKAGLEEKEANLISDASPMHDIGKVAIPDSVLHKPGPLNDAEWLVMRSHSAIGHTVLSGSDRPLLNAASIIAHEHHEKYNGSGYPSGLIGENIHIYARIVAIADVFDALGSDRVYKKAWSLDKIITLFKEEKGKHFDPRLVELFLDNLEEFLVIRDRYKDSIL